MIDSSLALPSARAESARARVVVATLAALAYPGILWCGVQLSPVFVVVSLAVPLLGVVAAAHPGVQRVPVWRGIAYLVVAVPPLFSLGAWLDFQHAVPIGSLGVWLPLWSALAVIAALSRDAPELAGSPAATPSRRLAIAHGISAAAVTTFALPHLLNHLAGLLGGETHIAVMTALRSVYRHPVVEPVLLGAVAFQVGSGLWLLWRKRGSTGWFATLQTSSGTYLLVFLLSHVSAALRARSRGVDPNWHWLAGGELLSDPWSVRLVPYYFLAVIALGLHGGCGLCGVLRSHRVTVSNTLVLVIATSFAAVISAMILLGLFRA